MSRSTTLGATSTQMQTGAGTIALIAAGVIIVAVGAYHVYKGAPAATLSMTSRATPATWCDDWAPWATSPKAW